MSLDGVTVSGTTDASGDVTFYTERITGFIHAIRYAKTDYADGVDFTITAETSGETIWTDTNINASEMVYPRRLLDDTAGADLTAVYDYVLLLDERVSIVIGSGGDTKAGAFTIYIDTIGNP